MTLYDINDPVIYRSDELGSLAGRIAAITSFGYSGLIKAYRVDTICGPILAYDRDLAPADNVVVLRHSMDTLPCEMDVPA